MGRKNRPTLKQQFLDFINRNPPYDVEPLIQKSEHNQVENDFFDSAVMQLEESVSITNPAALINLDFDTTQLFNINSQSSTDTDFTITISNLPDGQLGKIAFIKKSNDTISFSNASSAQITNLDQFGSVVNIVVVNVSGNFVIFRDETITKSDSTNSNNTNTLATSKAVRDLRVYSDSRDDNLQNQIDNIVVSPGAWVNLPIEPNIQIVDGQTIQYRISLDGDIEFRGLFSFDGIAFLSIRVCPNGSIPAAYRARTTFNGLYFPIYNQDRTDPRDSIGSLYIDSFGAMYTRAQAVSLIRLVNLYGIKYPALQ